jgi:N-acetylmuramoyl-L-alanine amidase
MTRTVPSTAPSHNFPKDNMIPRPKLALLLLALAFCGLRSDAAFEIRSVTVKGRIYVPLTDVAKYYGLQIWRSGDRVMLYSNRHRVQFNKNVRKMHIDKIMSYLFFPMLRHQNVDVISAEDFTLFLDPILRPWGLPDREVRTIMLDPGHGGKDAGASGTRYKEKNLNLAMARQVANLLRARGYNVVFTRNDDSYPTLSQRTALAKQVKADLFVSIHNNATIQKTVTGIECFLATPKGTPAIHRQTPEKDSVLNNAYDRYNALLGYEIHRRLIHNTQGKDRGIKYRRFQVLSDAPCPAILIEGGFLSNDKEEYLLGHPAYQARICSAIADGIVAYHQGLQMAPR